MINVLIVDDEPFIRQGLKILIDWEEYGFSIADEAANGREAMRLLTEKSYNLVITDIKMPEMDGMEFVKEIRKHISKELKIIILSGYYEFGYAKQAIRYNVTDYILKPIQKEELIKVLLEFKESYNKEVKRSQNKAYTESVALEHHLNALCSGIYEKSNIIYLEKKLPHAKRLRYISIEMSLLDEKFRVLSEQDKRSVLNRFCEELRESVAPYGEYVFLDVDKRNEIYGVGFIYMEQFAKERNITEDEYIVYLQERMAIKQPYKTHLYIGQRVERLDQLSASFKSAVIAKAFQKYKNDKDIAYYDEMSMIRTTAYGIKKEYMDELIQCTEQNDEDKIDQCVDKIYANFKRYHVDPAIINLNINYLLCEFLYLAKELDPEVDQEEVLQYINECVFEQSIARGSAKHFKIFVKDFARYLSQLRQNNSYCILKKVEKEVEAHYMENLSLKYLSEKYYINSAYLGQVFKKRYGTSFKDYLNQYRIEKASELLIRTNEKVYTIAQDVGYNNLDYFINKFVRMKGKTPLQYRKHFIKNHEENVT